MVTNKNEALAKLQQLCIHAEATSNWPNNLKQAFKLQLQLATKVKLCPISHPINLLAAMDAVYDEEHIYVGIVLWDINQSKPLQTIVTRQKVIFPYIPGYLAFREAKAYISALKELQLVPDLLLIDGQGIAHPRRIGLASHIGVLIDFPTVGCAKKLLVGKPAGVLSNEKGSFVDIVEHDEIIGYLVRTKSGTQPLVVSPGHKIDGMGALHIIFQTLTKYRIPDPLRLAEQIARAYKKQATTFSY